MPLPSVLWSAESPKRLSREEDPRFKAYWVKRWCAENAGTSEVKLIDESRADAVTEMLAVKLEWANDWKDAIGRSLSYAVHTNKTAHIVLLLREERDRRFGVRLRSVIDYYHLPITVEEVVTWTVASE
ncbi:MAG: hypothetical protein AAF191_17470 [Verrucomicrobiota bacterium]